MNKKLYILSAFVLATATGMINPTDSFSGNLSSTSGEKITIAATATLPAFEFQPSPQVKMAGTTAKDAFTVLAVHDSVTTKINGEAYAMASEKSGLYVLNNTKDGTLALPTDYTTGQPPATFKLPSET